RPPAATSTSPLCSFLTDTATTDLYTLSLHDALPIFSTWVTFCGWSTSIPERKSSGSATSSRTAWKRRATPSPFPPTGSTTMSSRSEEHTSELQSRENLVCRLLLEKKKTKVQRPRSPL